MNVNIERICALESFLNCNQKRIKMDKKKFMLKIQKLMKKSKIKIQKNTIPWPRLWRI
jgi:hypothetical protein